jgi:hypothetical protein
MAMHRRIAPDQLALLVALLALAFCVYGYINW